MKNLILRRDNSLKKRYIFLAISILFSTNIFAQLSSKLDPEVHSFYKDSLIEITYQYGNCNLIYDGINKDEVYLKFQNLSGEKLEVSWELVLRYNNRCYNCERENAELKFTTVLGPNQTIEGKCEEENPFQLKIFSSFLNNESEAKLKDFDIKYLQTKTHPKQ